MTKLNEVDVEYMHRTLQLATQGLFTTGVNPRVGCIIVKDSIAIGEGFHEFTGGPHAEVTALANATTTSKGATAYVSLEPCSHYGLTPPCVDQLIESQVQRVVICCQDPNPQTRGQSIAKLRTHSIEVVEGVLNEKGIDLNRGFFHRMRTGQPWLRLKMAQSLDGRTAMKNGESRWITGPKSRQDVQYWRARSHAIITGIGTVLQDDCRLSVRPTELTDEFKALPQRFDNYQPLRVVLDTHLRIPVDAKILNSVGRRVIMTKHSTDNAYQIKANDLRKRGVELVNIAVDSDNKLELVEILNWLGKQEINEVLIETGATLAGQFVKKKLVNELIMYTAPVLLGQTARPLFGIEIENMENRLYLNDMQLKQFGKDWRITASL